MPFRDVKIAPSILSANFGNLCRDSQLVEKSGAGLLHLDVMDGHFVPNITFGPDVVKALRRCVSMPLDVHLMIENPQKYVDQFAEAGADLISFHIEATKHPGRVIAAIRKHANVKVGIAINPPTKLKTVTSLLSEIDFVLVMSVNPGFAGQAFMPEVLEKVSLLRHEIRSKSLQLEVEVDGGIGPENVADVARSGADMIVAGSAIFRSSNPAETLRAMRRAVASLSLR